MNISAQQTVTDTHALSELLSRARPLGSLVAWAERSGDVQWQDIAPHIVELARVSDQIVRTVERETMGTLPLSVWWISRATAPEGQLEAAFAGTRYGFQSVYGCSPPADNRYSPPLYFAVVGVLRDIADPGTGPQGILGIQQRLAALGVASVPAVAHSLAPTTWRAEQSFEETLMQRLGVYR